MYGYQMSQLWMRPLDWLHIRSYRYWKTDGRSKYDSCPYASRNGHGLSHLQFFLKTTHPKTPKKAVFLERYTVKQAIST